jgi:hypothetical protein
MRAGIGWTKEAAVKRFLALVVAALCFAAVCVAVAGASTTLSWSATFPEQFGGPNHSPFSCAPGTSCGSGEVTGLGQAQDVIVFRACGPNCDVRTLTFGDGSTLVLHESASNFQTPGNSDNAPTQTSYGHPFSLDLSDTIVGGTGRFAGASGSASGQVHLAGGTAIINLSGTVTF